MTGHFTTVTWEITDEGHAVEGHRRPRPAGAPLADAMVDGDAMVNEGGGGWDWILSDLRSLLKTGASLES